MGGAVLSPAQAGPPPAYLSAAARTARQGGSAVLVGDSPWAMMSSAKPVRLALVAAALALLAAAGCVSTWKYQKLGVDEAQTQRDLDLCVEVAKVPRKPRPIELSGGAVTGFPYEGVDPQAVDACMTRKGYTRVDP
jgi:hypothetical protein